MKRLYLLRHVKSSWDDPALPDFDRPLSKRGRRAGTALGRHMADEGLLPSVVLSSTARRARDTWRQVSAEWIEPPKPQFDDRLYMADSETMRDLLAELPNDADRVMMIGHNPGMAMLALDLAATTRTATLARMRAKYPTGGLAIFDLAIERWSAIVPHCGKLIGFVTPRDFS
jgi:phosphohistidine phosphatase